MTGGMVPDPGRLLRQARPRRPRIFAPMNEHERALLDSIGMKSSTPRVLTRRPLTIAFARFSSLPSLAVALLVVAICERNGTLSALTAGAIAGLALTLGIIVHELGHLLAGRWVRGIEPRMLLVRSTGGVSIVEGRYEDARGAAMFALGGPLASLAVCVAYAVGGMLLPAGPFRVALLVPAALTFSLLLVNLLPTAPTDGYLLFRSLLWHDLGSREAAERRALEWSRAVIVWALLLSLLLLHVNQRAGLAAVFLLGALAMQHHATVRQVLARDAAGARRPGEQPR
jgi:Zn-dependent protease